MRILREVGVIDFFKQILTSQYGASLQMMKQCVEACKPEHWEGKVANDSFRSVAYHAIFCTDFYLTQSSEAFVLRDFHQRGGDERQPTPSAGLEKEDTLAYLKMCREWMVQSVAAETQTSLEGPSGFSYRKISRGELHVYNVRHLQHHVGQLSAYLRRVDAELSDPAALPWIGDTRVSNGK